MTIHSKKLDVIVGKYYNSETSYYEALREMCSLEGEYIWNLDTAIRALIDGHKAVMSGKEISFDINFIVKEK